MFSQSEDTRFQLTSPAYLFLFLLASALFRPDNSFADGDVDLLREDLTKVERSILGKIAAQNQNHELLANQIRESSGKIEALKFQQEREINDLASKLTKISERLDFLEKKITILEDEGQKIGHVGTAEKSKKLKASALESQPQPFFQQGLTQYQKASFDAAKMTWMRFLELYPKHALAPEVHSYLGDIYFKTKKYDQAILEFNVVIDNFPTFAKVPEAWYMTALCYLQKNNKEDALLFLKHIIAEFPKSKGAILAQNKLEQMGSHEPSSASNNKGKSTKKKSSKKK